MNVHAIYEGSDGEATRALYVRLTEMGPAGVVALNLFRAQKCSARAKVYRGGNRHGSYKGQAYGRKEYSLRELCAALEQHGADLQIAWGWKEDPAQEFHRWVLYVELPSGQVSFHAATAIGQRRFAGEWDRSHNSASRIVCHVASLLGQKIQKK